MEQPGAALRSHARFTLGLPLGATPATLVMLLGVVLGPYGLGLLTPGVLASLDPAIPVALTALGVRVGLGFNLRTQRDRRVLAATSLGAAVTMVMVGAGIALLSPVWSSTLELPVWFCVALFAICAADDPLPILLGGIALVFLREATPETAMMLALQATAVTIVIGGAGWLLLARSSAGTEQRIFVIALLLLLGGAAEYLSLSTLAGGLLAGFFWEAAGGSTREAVRRDVLYVQRPLLVLILVILGAQLTLTPLVLTIGLFYLLLRLVGSITGSSVARRFMPSLPARDANADSTLLSPGIVGLAFALNAVRAAGTDAATVIGIAIVGAIGSELLTPFFTSREAVE